MSNVLEEIDLPTLNAAFAAADPAKVISWAAGAFGPDLVMTSSFGADSAVLIHMATRIIPDIRIIFVNTGYLFPETHQFMEQLRQRFNLNIWTFRTPNDPIAWLHKAGEENPMWRKDVDACCAANKNEPMERAMRALTPRGWLRGVRRDQSASRKNVQIIDFAPRYDCYAISPLARWSSRDVYYYMKQHELPYHPLHEKGYLSIGCNPQSCTRPVQIGEDARAGRWADAGKLECGINVLDSLDSSQL